jgi:hypothetical protein
MSIHIYKTEFIFYMFLFFQNFIQKKIVLDLN